MTRPQNLPMLLVFYATAFLSAFNENIINVALVDITTTFGITATTAQWLVTGYMIASSVIMAAMAFLTARFTIKKLFMISAAAIIVGSAAAMMAPNFPLLLAARLVQAIGTGMFAPLMMVCILALAPKDRVATFIAAGAGCITLGPATGPIVSGAMVTLFGWRFIFAPPLLFMVLFLIAGCIFVKPLEQPTGASFDPASLALSSVGLTIVVYALSQIAANPLPSSGILLIGIAVLAVFAKRQLTLETPFLDIRPLAQIRFTIATIIFLLGMVCSFSMSVLMPLYFQNALGVSAFYSGLFILPPIIANAISSFVSGRILDRFGPWPLIPAGALLILMGELLCWAFSGTLSAAAIIAAATFSYTGVGLVMPPVQSMGLTYLPEKYQSSGISLMNVFNMVAASFAPSLLISIMTSASDTALAQGTVFQVAHATGFGITMLGAAAFAIVGLALSIGYCRKK